MTPFRVTTEIDLDTEQIHIQLFFLDCQERLDNAFMDPEVAELLGRAYIMGAVQLNPHTQVLVNRWQWKRGEYAPEMYWLTCEGEAPGELPAYLSQPDDALAIGATLMQMAFTMRLNETLALKEIA